MSGTCQTILVNSDRTLAEVTFANAHRISTTVTHSSVVVADWINETIQGCCSSGGPCQRHLVGLEVACQPDGNIVLVQLCVGSRCLVYQLLHRDRSRDPGLPRELLAFLDDSRFCFAGAGVEVVAYGLQMEHRISVRNTADLGDAAATRLGREDLRRAGVERLAREVAGLEMDASAEVRRSDWWRQDLSQEQIACACADAFASFELGRILFTIKPN